MNNKNNNHKFTNYSSTMFSPGPGSYQISSCFDRSNTKGVSFKSRPKTLESNDRPGPGYYNIRSTIGQGSKFSLKSRSNSSSNLNTNPGPGQYDIKSTFANSKQGFSITSRIDKTRNSFAGTTNMFSELFLLFFFHTIRIFNTNCVIIVPTQTLPVRASTM